MNLFIKQKLTDFENKFMVMKGEGWGGMNRDKGDGKDTSYMEWVIKNLLYSPGKCSVILNVL